MKIRLVVNDVEVFNDENVKDEITGKVESKDLYLGLYLQGKRGTPFTKLHVSKTPDIEPIIVGALSTEKVKQVMSFFACPKQSTVAVQATVKK
jgi:hypothetical protein